jgi:hypothetical protein
MMKTKRWLAPAMMALAGLTLLLASALLSRSSVTVAAAPPAIPTSTLARIPGVVPGSVLAAPDLIVEDITYDPANPGVGESVDITVTVKNQGDASGPGFYVYLYVDPADQPPTSTTSYTSRTYWGLPVNPGASFKWVHTNHTFAVDGSHPVYAWVDRDNDVAESDETNNLTGPVFIPVGQVHGPDSYEDDDLCSQANPIPVDGTEQQHNLYPAPDKDWVKFDAIGGVTYRVQAIADGADARLVVELHGTCASPPSFGSGAEFDFTAPADGTYYIKVEHVLADYGPDTDYRLRVTAQGLCNGYHEPNNACVTAADIAVDAAPQVHSFCQVSDDDWVRFQTTAGSTYIISATNVGVNADAQLSLCTLCDASPVLTDGQRLEYIALTDGVAYVRAQNLNPATYGPGTEYKLQVVWVSDCTPDAYEGDDTAAVASTLIAGGAAQTHNLCPAGDVDWAKLDATAGVTYTLETFNLGDAADTVLCLFDAAGAVQLACDDDSGPGNGSRITWQAPAQDTYTLRVTDYDATEDFAQARHVAGPDTRYDLHAFVGSCIPDPSEPDDTQATARPIPADGRKQAHNTCLAGDVDWVHFAASAGSYVIETTDLASDADTFVELYNASGQRLAFNDDYGPDTASRIHYTFSSGGTYYIKVRHYNPTRSGTGTEYSLRIYQGNPPPPTLTPTPPPTVTPTPTPDPSQVQTVILVNRERVAALYEETAATQLMDTLDTLAVHSSVQGEVIRLDLNDTVSAAYADWVADETDVTKANQVTAAIRGVIMSYLEQHDSVEHIVLVGDDRLLPFRRIPDNTPRSDHLERDYARVDDDHPTGAALRANYFLSDDYYADREPTPFQGRELYIPDLGLGRLIETPDEIIAFIDAFLADPQVTVGDGGSRVLITGYDFVQDTAYATCADWGADLGTGNVDCTLIGYSWPLSEYRARQLSADPPYKVQCICGHANHYREGAPGWGQFIGADEISSALSDLSRGLIYTLGCHSGLNVPPDNDIGPLDLPQAFVQKLANYVANTGYGWGLRGAIGLSEKLMRLYTEELRREGYVSIGRALAAAKRRYYQEEQGFTGYDEKILEESVFYGLPMYRLNTGSALGPADDPFPSVDIGSSLPGAFGDEAVVSGTVSVQLVGAFGPSDVMSREVTSDGIYYLLDGHIHAVPGQPAQPLLYADVTAANWPARSAVFRGGEYETLSNYDPVIVSPVNDYLTETAEAPFGELGWYPPVPVGLQNHRGESSLVGQMGQYDPSSQQARLYGAMELDLYYSLSTDREPPQFTVVDGLYDRATGRVNVKVGANDPAGVQRAVATYTSGDGSWDSVELSFDTSLHKWTGSLPGDTNLRYFVQVVDGAGNVAQEANKGLYFSPAVDPTSQSYFVKTVTPQGWVDYGDELTYTLVMSASPGTQVGFYDPLEGTAFTRFVELPTGVITHTGGVITGTLMVTPTNQITISFVVRVGVPGTAGWTVPVNNRACVYPLGGTLGYCVWSNEVTNLAFRPYGIYLPMVLRSP